MSKGEGRGGKAPLQRVAGRPGGGGARGRRLPVGEGTKGQHRGGHSGGEGREAGAARWNRRASQAARGRGRGPARRVPGGYGERERSGGARRGPLGRARR